MKDYFFSIDKKGEGIYKEKGSKFLSFCYPVSNSSEIDHHLEDLRKTFHDARHHCYAWVLGEDQQHTRANDDGEPSHSAGDPILGQIRAHNLTNTLVVVIRYFGGTKLGVGGLIQAYKIAADQTLNSVGTRKHLIEKEFIIKYTYDQTSTVLRWVNESGSRIIKQDFTENCSLRLGILRSKVKYETERLRDLEQRNIILSLHIK